MNTCPFQTDSHTYTHCDVYMSVLHMLHDVLAVREQHGPGNHFVVAVCATARNRDGHRGDHLII